MFLIKTSNLNMFHRIGNYYLLEEPSGSWGSKKISIRHYEPVIILVFYLPRSLGLRPLSGWVQHKNAVP